MSNPKLQIPNPNHSQRPHPKDAQLPNPKAVALSNSDWDLEVGSGWSLGFGAWDLAAHLTRRAALKLLAPSPSASRSRRAKPAHSAAPHSTAPRAPLDPQQVDSFLAIHPDGAITIYTSKVDVGTGMRIAIAQMAAEELGVAGSDASRWSTAIPGDARTTAAPAAAPASTRGGTAVRQAAATARQALLRLGAERLKPPVADLTIVDGEVRRRHGETRDWHRPAGARTAAVRGRRPRRAARGAVDAIRSSALHRSGRTCPPSAPDATPTSRTSAFPACSTRA